MPPPPPLPPSVPVGRFRIDPTLRRAAVAVGVLGPLVAAAIVASTAPPIQVKTAIVLAPFVVFVVVLAVESLTRRIDVDAEAITKRGPLRTRTLRFAEITTVAYTINSKESMNAFRVELFGDAVGTRIAIDAKYWDRTNDLVQLARALDPQHRADPVSERLAADARWRLGERPGEGPLRRG